MSKPILKVNMGKPQAVSISTLDMKDLEFSTQAYQGSTSRSISKLKWFNAPSLQHGINLIWPNLEEFFVFAKARG